MACKDHQSNGSKVLELSLGSGIILITVLWVWCAGFRHEYTVVGQPPFSYCFSGSNTEIHVLPYGSVCDPLFGIRKVKMLNILPSPLVSSPVFEGGAVTYTGSSLFQTPPRLSCIRRHDHSRLCAPTKTLIFFSWDPIPAVLYGC